MAEVVVAGSAIAIAKALSGTYTTSLGAVLPGVGCFRRAVERGQYDTHDVRYDDLTFNHWTELSIATRIGSVDKKKSQLFHVGGYFGESGSVRTKDIVEACRKHGLLHRGIREILDFGEEHPDVQREFQIVALGSAWIWDRDPDDLGVALLTGDENTRELGLVSYDSPWPPETRVLVCTE